MSTNPPVPTSNKAVYIGNLGQTPAPAAQAPQAINAIPTYSPQVNGVAEPGPSPATPTNLPTYTNNPVNYAWSPAALDRQTPPPRAGQFLLAAPGSFRPADDLAINYSKLTGLSYASPADAPLGGFCRTNATNPGQIDSVCNSLDTNVCASTQCCVLIGGSGDGSAAGRCVAGGENGPVMTSYYTDPTIMHRDRYYYQGKCYGNCSNNPIGSPSLPPVPAAPLPAAPLPAAAPAAAPAAPLPAAPLPAAAPAAAPAAPLPAAPAAPLPAAPAAPAHPLPPGTGGAKPTVAASGINYAVLADAAIVAGALLL